MVHRDVLLQVGVLAGRRLLLLQVAVALDVMSGKHASASVRSTHSLQSVRAAHREGLRQRLVYHMRVLLHLKGHLLGGRLVAHIGERVGLIDHPGSLLVLVQVAVPERVL